MEPLLERPSGVPNLLLSVLKQFVDTNWCEDVFPQHFCQLLIFNTDHHRRTPVFLLNWTFKWFGVRVYSLGQSLYVANPPCWDICVVISNESLHFRPCAVSHALGAVIIVEKLGKAWSCFTVLISLWVTRQRLRLDFLLSKFPYDLQHCSKVNSVQWTGFDSSRCAVAYRWQFAIYIQPTSTNVTKLRTQGMPLITKSADTCCRYADWNLCLLIIDHNLSNWTI